MASITGQFLTQYAGVFSTLIYVLELIVAGVIGIVIVWYFIYRKKFDIQVEIRSVRTDAYGNKIWKVLIDKGGWIKDRRTGATVFRLFKAKRNFEPPPYEYLEPASIGTFIKNKAYAIQTDDDKLHWIKPAYVSTKECPKCKGSGVDEYNQNCPTCLGKKMIPSEIAYKISDKDVEFWAANQMESDLQTFGKPKWWEPLLMPISIMVASVIMLIVIWLVIDYAGAVTGVCGQTTEMCSQMAKACATSASTTTTPTIPQPPGW